MASIRVLLVDDEEQFLATTKVLLDKRGIETVTATSGVEALTILEERPIDVVILDVKMPGMNGVEVLRMIKQRGYPLEVILLTGHAAVDSAVEGLKLGAFDYVMKPCDIPDLVAKIREAFENKLLKERKGKPPVP